VWQFKFFGCCNVGNQIFFITTRLGDLKKFGCYTMWRSNFFSVAIGYMIEFFKFPYCTQPNFVRCHKVYDDQSGFNFNCP
jgi:hypothetical protein